ncbi:MAG: SDR family oxidoreductase [Oscillospiraceae bacterium]|nr:SDR family oxidoreductase [Oscillospiraceae bacterium]
MKQIFKDRFKDKVMIITGGARGIGAVTAIRAAAEGAKVVIADIREEEGNATVAQIKEAGGEAMFLHLDISIEENCKLLVEKTVEKYGRLDLAVNNAGVTGNGGKVENITREGLDICMLNNFYACFFCCKYELQQFSKQEEPAAIVNLGSINGLIGPGNSPYTCSKHAINGLTKAISFEYAPKVRCNSVNPDRTNTPMIKEAEDIVKNIFVSRGMKVPDQSAINQMMNQSMRKTPLYPENAEPDEQAAAILFLLSDDASHISGLTMAVDGGYCSF